MNQTTQTTPARPRTTANAPAQDLRGQAMLNDLPGSEQWDRFQRRRAPRDLTLREAALASGDIDAKGFDQSVDPKKLVGHGAGGS